jgi:hypothetical protein
MDAALGVDGESEIDVVDLCECCCRDGGCSDSTGKPGEVLGGFEEALPKLYAIMGTLAAGGVGNKIAMKPKASTTTTTTAAGQAGGGAAPTGNASTGYWRPTAPGVGSATWAG